MIVITKQITKNELLKEMAGLVGAPDVALHLEVESLPNFLNTPVAFTIFNYQISNFPKPVFWLSYDREVVHFLHNCQANFPPNFLAAQQPLLTTQTPEFSKEYLSLVSQEFENTDLANSDLAEGLGLNELPQDFELPKIKMVESLHESASERVSDFTRQKASFIDFNSSRPKKPNLNLQQEFQQELDSQKDTQQASRKKIDFNFPISEQLKHISEYESLSAKNLFRQNRYNRSTLIGDDQIEKPNKPGAKIWNRLFKAFTNFFSLKSKPKPVLINPNFTSAQFPSDQMDFEDQQNLTSNFGSIPQSHQINYEDYSTDYFQPEIETENNWPTNSNFSQPPITLAGNLPKNDQNPEGKVRFHEDVFSGFNQNRLGQLWSFLTKQSLLKKNAFIAGITSLSLAVFIVLFFVSFFPTQAYTLEISPVSGAGEAEFELNLQQFETQNLTLETEVQTIPTGKENLSLPKAVGKVQLINRGNSPVLLTNGGFLLVSKERVYFQLPTGNSSTLVIPANNQAKPLEVQIEAENKGDNYNLPIGETLAIANLKGEGVCDNCFGTTIEEVKNSKPNPANIISESDKKSLTDKANGEITTKVNQEVQKMIQTGHLSDPSWVKTLDKTQTFLGEVGKPASELKLTTKANLNLFGLKNSQIFRLLKERNDKIFQANDFQIVSASGWDSESKSVKIKLSYNFSQYENLSTDEILAELSQSPVSEVEKKFQAKYSGLKNILKEEKGLKVPGITPRVNIDIIKNEKMDVNN